MTGDAAAQLSAADVVRLLDLQPHPEGGHFRETFRDAGTVAGRSHSTAILYLLAAGERSHWHRVDAVEVWHHYGGAPLRLSLSPDGNRADHHRLGVDLLAGERPVTIASLVQMIAEVQGVQPPSIHLPVILGKVAGIAFQTAFKPLGRQPPFSRRSLDFFIKDNAYDISKAKQNLGFQPQVDLQAGLMESWRWLNGCKTARPN